MPLAEAPPWPPTPAPLFCSNATGVPGEVAVEVKGGVRILQATPTGFVVRGPILPLPGICPEVQAQPNGAAVATGEDGNALAVAVRDTGGAWVAPVELTRSEDWRIDDVQSAIAPSGDTVVAWTETQILEETHRIRVARRAPGQPFGPVETFASRLPAAVWAGVASTGESFLMTATIESERLPLSVPVRVAIAPRATPFGAPAELGRTPWRFTPALAVAPDGRALVAIPDGTSLLVAERAPGEAFGPAAAVAPATDPKSITADVALRPDGAAAVLSDGDVEEARAIVTRAGPGPFTSLVTLAPRVPFTGDPFFASQTLDAISGLEDGIRHRAHSSIRLTADGHAALASQPAPAVDGLHIPRARLTTVPLGGDRAESQLFGGEIGFAAGAEALELADGRPALIWNEWIDESDSLHLAAPEATTPADPSPPRVTVGAPAKRVLDPDADVKLPVRCSGPCDVRVQSFGGPIAHGRLRLPRGGRGNVVLTQGSVPLAPRRRGRVRLRVTYGSLGTLQPRVKVVSFRLTRAHVATTPVPRPFGLRAVRHGGTIRVTWRVRNPDDFELFWVTGAATREWSGEPAVFDTAHSTKPKRSYTLNLRDDARVRYVTLRNVDGSVRLTVPLRE